MVIFKNEKQIWKLNKLCKYWVLNDFIMLKIDQYDDRIV